MKKNHESEASIRHFNQIKTRISQTIWYAELGFAENIVFINLLPTVLGGNAYETTKLNRNCKKDG